MAADVSARVHLVAEKLQQKAQAAQRKGNEAAARALSASVADLRHALTLISEQRHLLARRRGEADDEDEADEAAQELATRLARVEAMLGKKSEDMRLKGNESAAAALQQSAAAVDKGRGLLAAQQQTIFGLLGRWEKLENVLGGSVTTGDEEEDRDVDTPHGRAIARVRRLVQLGAVIAEAFPAVKEVDEVREEVEKLKQTDGLRQELEAARDEAGEAREMLKQESLALEEVNKELQVQRQREALRQEEDAALLEQQREACQAMEELVRESDQEIQRMTQSAKASAEEMQSLRVEIESLAMEKERLGRAHANEMEELQAQLASAMDAISIKMDEGDGSSEEELQILQKNFYCLTSEKEELVKAHSDEVEELRRELEAVTASLAAESEEIAASNNEELQSLRTKVDNLTSDNENLVKLHTAEVEELEKAFTLEIEELHQQLESATKDLTTKTGESAAVDADELQSLQAMVDSLTSEKDKLKNAHSYEVKELQKAHTSELEDIRHQLESATVCISSATKQGGESDAEELQALKDEINNLVSEKEQLAEVHASELEQLREAHVSELENLRYQLDSASADFSSKTKKEAVLNAGELQQLRAEVGALIIEKGHLVKEHADRIEKLNHQVESAKAGAENVSEGHEPDSNEEEDGGDNEDNGDVPVLELEEEESQLADFAAADELEASSNGADGVPNDFKEASKMQAAIDDLQSQLADYHERAQTQKDTISSLEREQAELQEQIGILSRDKAQAVENLQRAHETETLILQTNLDGMQTQISEYAERYAAQQNRIVSLEKDQTELRERIELLMHEKAQIVGELHSTHGEETTRLAQRLTDSEGTIESMSAQLEEMRNALEAKSAEHSETAQILKSCEAELEICRSELGARIHECTQVKNDILAIQDAGAAQSGEISERLSQLTSELRKMAAMLTSKDRMDAEAAQNFTETVWQSQEVMELFNGVAPLLSDLIFARNELQTAEKQLESMRSEGDNRKLVIEQFLKTSDWHLFAKVGDEEEEVVGALDSDKDVSEHLEVAQANILRWLDELQQLRNCVDKDMVKVNELEQEKIQRQEYLVALEDSKRNLEVEIETLRERLVVLQTENEEMVKVAEKLKAQKQSASIQGQQQQTAQQEEVDELQQQLTSVRSDFERYRVRSHTALKKMEKRAELLNGMRKENETLLKEVEESDELREQADAACKDSEARLQEVQRTQEMMQADFDQFAMEKARVIADLEEEEQRLLSEREQTDTRIQELTLKIQELETEKKQIEEESERIKEAEQAAFQARLNTATAAAQTAKQDLQKVHDVLEASKAENDRRQKLIDSLELKLEQQTTTTSTAIDTRDPVANTNAPVSAAYVPPLASPSAEVRINVGELEKELAASRASEAGLRKQLDDARAELIALQERFATTKAATAEKVFALEEQSNHWKMELDASTEEVRRLTAVLDAQTKMTTHSPQANGLSNSTPDASSRAQMTAIVEPQEEKPAANITRIQELSGEIRELKTELADANTEITLLTRALDASREELQDTRDQIEAFTPSSEPEGGEDPGAGSKISAVLVAKDEALKKLRVQVLELKEELQTLREEKMTLELEREKGELDELQASRKHVQTEKERAMQLKRRQTLVSSFEKQVSVIVDELQRRLEEHSTAFREVCDFRDEHRTKLLTDGGGSANAGGHGSEPAFEECLVMRSGVVIKAGASFQLPVICEKRGWRVVWNFSVKEDAADVSFKLSAVMADATSTEVEVVSPERMNEMSGVFQVQQDNTTLVFEWDNSFSWLNEKTLDYHVSIQEPLTPQAQKVRQGERDLEAKAKLLEDGQALIQVEAQRRSELSTTLERLAECEAAKNKHLEEFGARKTEVLAQKSGFQEEMDAQKAAFSAMLQEQDELEDIERGIIQAWKAAVAEREDVEMTLQLAGNGSQLETLAHEMEEQAKAVAEQLKNPIRADDSVESSKGEEENAVNDEDDVKQDGTLGQELESDYASGPTTQQKVETDVSEIENKQEQSSEEKQSSDVPTELVE